MTEAPSDEWGVIQTLLPVGWREAAHSEGALRRVRNVNESGLLRLLLFHAANDGGLRSTATQAQLSGIAVMSQVALFNHLRKAGAWLAWIGAALCATLRERPRVPDGLRFRVVDSTTVQGPASRGTDWRLHYALDLVTCTCDWFELTDAHGGEALERTPIRKGDVLLADRNYLRLSALRAAARAGADVLIRMRWTHPPMHDARGRVFSALGHAKRLKVGQIGDWPAIINDVDNLPIHGRVVATRLPAPLVDKALRRIRDRARRKRIRPDLRTLQAAQFVMLFTTLPADVLSGQAVLELYRYRWQIELAFKRLKQLLNLGQLPHKDRRAAEAWILSKLVLALLLEVLYRNASSISPWGYIFPAGEAPAA